MNERLYENKIKTFFFIIIVKIIIIFFHKIQKK